MEAKLEEGWMQRQMDIVGDRVNATWSDRQFLEVGCRVPTREERFEALKWWVGKFGFTLKDEKNDRT